MSHTHQFSSDVLTPLLHVKYIYVPFPEEILGSCRNIFTNMWILRGQVISHPNILRRHRKKNWVIFHENTSMHPVSLYDQRDILRYFIDLAQPNLVVLQLPCDPLYTQFFRTNFNFPIYHNFIIPPWVWTIQPNDVSNRKPIWLPYADTVHKGLDIVERLAQFVPVEILKWQYSPVEVAHKLGNSYGIPFCSRADSHSRHWWTGLFMKCALVHLRTQAQFYWNVTLLGKDLSFYELFPVYDNEQFFIEAVTKLHNNDEERIKVVENGQKWLQKDNVQEMVNYWTQWDKWHRRFGCDIPLGADITPFHQFGENYFAPEMIYSSLFPDGPWKSRPIPIIYSDEFSSC